MRLKLRELSSLFIIFITCAFFTGSSSFAQNKSNPSSPSNNTCALYAVDSQQVPRSENLVFEQRLAFDLPKGVNRIRLACALNDQSILRFGRRYIVGSPVLFGNKEVLEIKSPSPSYLLPATRFEVEFEINLYNKSTQYFYWEPLDQAMHKSMVQNLVMGTFYGICAGLVIYVFCMGRILSDKSFKLYTLYIFCATVFFLLQEGHLNIVFPAYSFELGQYWYVLFAALTVVSATVFIVNITDVNKMWPNISYYGLYPAAVFVLVLAIGSLFIESVLVANYTDLLMARTTLGIMLVVFVLVFLQALKKVPLAWLVFLSLLLMVCAMGLRTLPLDVSPFVQRYSLVVAFVIEAFIFAVVIMSRVQLIKHEKLLAQTQANTDVLCAVLNRRGWMQQAELLIDQQAKEGGIISTLFIDIDKFKSINDNYGHEVGDKVLQIVARIISNQTRKGGLVGRLGGDEFVVIGLFDTQKEPIVLAERIQKRLSHTALSIDDGLTIELSASLGYVTIDKPTSITEILRIADHKMYQNKRNKDDLAVSN